MEKYLPIVNRKHCRKIWLSDILYIMQEGRLTHVVTENETFSTFALHPKAKAEKIS